MKLCGLRFFVCLLFFSLSLWLYLVLLLVPFIINLREMMPEYKTGEC